MDRFFQLEHVKDRISKCAHGHFSGASLGIGLVIMLAATCLALPACASGGFSDSSSPNIYKYKDAGFEAAFPEKPKQTKSAGIYQEIEDTWIAGSEDITIVQLGDAPQVLIDFVNRSPMEAEIEESLDANLELLLLSESLRFGFYCNVDAADFSNYGFASPYSGIITCDGVLDYSEYGGSSEYHTVFCCAMVYSDSKVYTMLVNRDTPEEAIDAVKTFKLLNASNEQNGTSSSSLSRAKTIPDNAIEWKDASSHVGETVTLYGPVADSTFASSSTNQPTFINVGAAYPSGNRVTIIVWGEDRGNFPSAPEKMYEGKTICVTGEIYVYDGVCNIKITSPGQIKIIG